MLHLSRGMAYKNALAGLDLGGGKAVIIGDPDRATRARRCCAPTAASSQSLNGRYSPRATSAPTSQDMDVVARESRFVTGRSPEYGGAGDSSVLTAYGVFQGMRASAEHRWGTPTLRGRRVGVAGVGKVGHHLVGHLVEDGAAVVVDRRLPRRAVNRVRAAHPRGGGRRRHRRADRAPTSTSTPPARSAARSTTPPSPRSRAKIVCGAANNQLAHAGVEKQLADRGILYAPDYVVNSGGVIQVADEIEGFNFERAKRKATRIFDTTLRDLHPGRRTRACRRRSPPTGSPSGGCSDVGSLARHLPSVSLLDRTPRQIPPVARGIDAGISAIVGSCL